MFLDARDEHAFIIFCLHCPFIFRDKILYYLFPHGDQSYFLHIFQGHAYPASETCSYYYSQEHDLQMDASDNTHFVFLIRGSVNITVGEKEERMMITGMHTVVDIFCVGCGAIVGWKYVGTMAFVFL